MSDKISKNMEIETKYAVSGVKSLEQAKDIFISLAEDIHRQRTFETTLHYYDTADFDLLKSGVVLRELDASPPHFGKCIYIKDNVPSNSNDSGVFTRNEYEMEVDSSSGPLQELETHPAIALLKPAKGKELVEFFKTINMREDLRGTFRVSGKEIMLECALDAVDFIDSSTGNLLQRSYELEIEFKQAYSDPAIKKEEVLHLLTEIADVMRQNISGLIPSSGSKADTGFSFYKKVIPSSSVTLSPRTIPPISP